jgi:hypothetical protein
LFDALPSLLLFSSFSLLMHQRGKQSTQLQARLAARREKTKLVRTKAAAKAAVAAQAAQDAAVAAATTAMNAAGGGGTVDVAAAAAAAAQEATAAAAASPAAAAAAEAAKVLKAETEGAMDAELARLKKELADTKIALKMHAEDRAQSQAEDEADAMRNRDEAKVERLRRQSMQQIDGTQWLS